MSTCSYKSPKDTKFKCDRERDNSSIYCCFHEPIDSPKKIHPETFLERLETLLDNNDGNWVGFNFPQNMSFGNIIFNSPIDLRFSSAKELKFDGCTFEKKVTFSNSIFSEEVTFSSSTYEEDVDFSFCIFEGNVVFSGSFLKEINFQKGEFKKISSFIGTYKGPVNFSNAIFYDAVTFRGGWNHSLTAKCGAMSMTGSVTLCINSQNKERSTSFFEKIGGQINKLKEFTKGKYTFFKNKLAKEIKHRSDKFKKFTRRVWKRVTPDNSTKRNPLFHGTVNFTDVDFRRPDRTKFINVDLNKATLIGADLKGVHFYDVNLWQPSLRRQGLYDEVYAIETQDRGYLKRMLPRLEAGYRNLRITLEENKDYATATDFYIGEMESRRRQKSF
ncbi:MAG: hypothetical protein GQ578_03695 [Desulfuromonadaceae bacterium]|nr:hypothetical protein [Desulfuromonadaceae bacterium]